MQDINLERKMDTLRRLSSVSAWLFDKLSAGWRSEWHNRLMLSLSLSNIHILNIFLTAFGRQGLAAAGVTNKYG